MNSSTFSNQPFEKFHMNSTTRKLLTLSFVQAPVLLTIEMQILIYILLFYITKGKPS